MVSCAHSSLWREPAVYVDALRRLSGYDSQYHVLDRGYERDASKECMCYMRSPGDR